MSQTNMDPRPLFFDLGNEEASSDGMLRDWVDAAIRSRTLEDSAFCHRHRIVESFSGSLFSVSGVSGADDDGDQCRPSLKPL